MVLHSAGSPVMSPFPALSPSQEVWQQKVPKSCLHLGQASVSHAVMRGAKRRAAVTLLRARGPEPRRGLCAEERADFTAQWDCFESGLQSLVEAGTWATTEALGISGLTMDTGPGRWEAGDSQHAWAFLYYFMCAVSVRAPARDCKAIESGNSRSPCFPGATHRQTLPGECKPV